MTEAEIREVLTDPTARELLESRELARLGYAGPDESPRVVPIGFVQQGIEIIVYSEPSTPKVKALRRDPRVALTIDVAGLRRDQLAAEVPRWVRSGGAHSVPNWPGTDEPRYVQEARRSPVEREWQDRPDYGDLIRYLPVEGSSSELRIPRCCCECGR